MATLAVVAVLAGCEAGERPAPTASPTAAATGCPVPAAAAADDRAALAPGPGNRVPPSTAVGEPLVVEAVVLDVACRPASAAEIRVWHTDARGLYAPPGSPDGVRCYYQGDMVADAAGRFRLDTIRPAQYPVPDAPPAHIHLEIRHPTGRLETEIVFTAPVPPTIAPPTGRTAPIVLRRDGAGWRGDVVLVLAG